MKSAGARVPVGRGLGPVRALPPNPQQVLELEAAGPEGRAPIEEILRETQTDAFVVLHGGELAAEWYSDPAVADTPQILMSVTKSFVGCAAGILVGRGLLELDTPVTDHIPELVGTGYATATVRDILDMRTGGDYVEDYDDSDGEVAAIVRALFPPPEPVPTIMELVAQTPRVAAHEGPFSYRSLDTEVLGLVLERVDGRSLVEILGEDLLAKLGVEHPGTMNVDSNGTAHAGGGLSLTARDVARFGQMVLDGGAVGNQQVVPTAFLKDIRVGGPDSRSAFTAGVERQFQVLPAPDGPPGAAVSTIYRNQFWVLEQGGTHLLCVGIHGQLVYIDADNDTVVVKLSSWPTPRDPIAFTAGLACAMTAAESLGGQFRSTPSLIA